MRSESGLSATAVRWMVASVVGAASGCSLIAPSDSELRGEARDASRTDGGVPGDAQASDAQAEGCASGDPSTLLCEDYGGTFDFAECNQSDRMTCRLTDSRFLSAPRALEIITTEPGQGCRCPFSLGAIKNVRLSFSVRFDVLSDRIGLFNIGFAKNLVGVIVYPDQVAFGEARDLGGGNFRYDVRATVNRPIPTQRWIRCELTLEGLGTQPTASLVFDGVTVEARGALVGWEGSELIGDVGLTDTEAAVTHLELDDVRIERLP